MPSGRIPIVLVASWYPSVADPVSGRFVADQVAALSARAIVAPAVVSFDPADLTGTQRDRARTAQAIATHVGAAIRTRDHLFQGVRGAEAPGRPSGGRPIPVARLGIPVGRHRGVGATHAFEARVKTLDALADRWLSGREVDVPRPAVVHAHTVYPDGAAAAHLAARLGCPLVLTEHASTVGRQVESAEVRKLYLATVRSSYRMIAVSRSLAAELAHAMPELEPIETVIPNGVEMSDFRAPPLAERRVNELLYVGHRKASKGISTLLEATKLARIDVPGLTLRLIGASPTQAIETGWRREAARLGIGEIVTFDGPTDRGGVADAMARASVFVHPSPRETFGVVAVEALASGLPVVASDSGGVTEILGDDVDALGAIAPRNSPVALAAAIVSTLNRRADFDPIHLRRSAAARYAAEVVAGRLEDLYGEAAGAKPPVGVTAVVSATAGGIESELEPSSAIPAMTRDVRLVLALDPGRASDVATAVGTSTSRAMAQGPVLVTTAGWSGAADAFSQVIRLPASVRVSGRNDAETLRSGHTGARHWLHLVRHPLALARRRGWLPGPAGSISAQGATVIRSVIESSGNGAAGPGEGPIEIVCCDGVDHLAAHEMVERGLATTAPGGVRWLGDLIGANQSAARARPGQDELSP